MSEQSSQSQLEKVPVDGSAPPVKLADWDNDWDHRYVWLEDDDLLIVSNQRHEVLPLADWRRSSEAGD